MQATETAENATLILSKSSKGSFEWMSLHAKSEWIHCNQTLDSLTCFRLPFLDTLPPGGKVYHSIFS